MPDVAQAVNALLGYVESQVLRFGQGIAGLGLASFGVQQIAGLRGDNERLIFRFPEGFFG
jgi:hypothetical protein